LIGKRLRAVHAEVASKHAVARVSAELLTNHG